MRIRFELILLVILALTVLTFLFNSGRPAEYANGTVKMNVTVGQFISITLSPALQSGIQFGQVSAGTNNNMALNDTTGGGNCTAYYITNDPSSTSSVNMWHKASSHLTYGSNVILIGNVTHEANQTSNGVNVNMTLTQDGNYQLTLSYAKIGGAPAPCDNVPAGGSCYIAYWLDVPSGIPSGVYETNYYYCANSTLGTAICS